MNYRMNNEISVLFLVKEMGNHVMMHDFNNKIKKHKKNLIGKLINLAILNSLANYTYTHQLLKCKAFCFKSIVLQLILVLLHFGARVEQE